MQYKGINIGVTGNSFFTDGLRRYIWKELSIPKDRQSEEDYLKVLIFLIDYICQPGIVIKPNQTITYHSWMLKFVENDPGLYEMWEVGQAGDDYRIGVEHSITVTNQQMDVCLQHNTTALFPTFNQKIVISKGVYEGLPLEAIKGAFRAGGWRNSRKSYALNCKIRLAIIGLYRRGTMGKSKTRTLFGRWPPLGNVTFQSFRNSKGLFSGIIVKSALQNVQLLILYCIDQPVRICNSTAPKTLILAL